MTDDNKLIKKLINYPESLVERIETYRFDNRIQTFSAAVIELLTERLDEIDNKEEPAE